MREYKDNTYFKYKERDKQRQKDLMDDSVSFEEYMAKHEIDDSEYQHDKFKNDIQKNNIEDTYLDAMEKINESHGNIMSQTLKLLRVKKNRGEL
tara:strand:- start:340 stop:621 length:282 start_codon:yes stop_codon:yes gene_type:complete